VVGLGWVWSLQVPAPPLPQQYPAVSALSLVVQEWWDWDVFGPLQVLAPALPQQYPAVPDLSLVMQEWWDWDRFGVWSLQVPATPLPQQYCTISD
jgi:hypothetical protein